MELIDELVGLGQKTEDGGDWVVGLGWFGIRKLITKNRILVAVTRVVAADGPKTEGCRVDGESTTKAQSW